MASAIPNLLQHIHNWDVDVFQRWQVRANRAQIMRFARKVSSTADGWPYPLFGIVYFMLEPITGTLLCMALGWAYLIERCCYLLMKKSCKRRRPPAAIPNFRSVIIASDEFSFPSGHTSGAFVFVTTCYLIFGPIVLPAYLWAGMVALSRISLGVHFPTDTVMGAVMGSSIALLSYYFLVA